MIAEKTAAGQPNNWREKPFKPRGDTVEIANTSYLRNGPIIPNFVTDVLVVNIGFEGVGLYTVLRRRANGGVARVGINALARAGGVGVRKVNALLRKLEDLGLIEVFRPSRAEIRSRKPTFVVFLDPPVEYCLAQDVRQRGFSPWQFEGD